MQDFDVITVGAGPVGLSLTLGLARQGMRVLLLERHAGVAEQSRAPAIWPRTQEIFAELGVIDRFAETGILVPKVELWDADRNRVLVTLPLEELHRETPYPRLLITPQSTTERLLIEAIQDSTSAEVRFESEVTELHEVADGVEVVYHSHLGEQRARASFVAGCDGARSRVRQHLGGSLEGITYDAKAALADVLLPDAASHRFPRLTTRPKLAIGIRMEARLWRLILPFSGSGEHGPLEHQVDQAVRSLFPGTDHETVWQSEFTLHRRVSSVWTSGRIALAGDAAHLNSPVGGEGMNAGIIDAAALRVALATAVADASTAPLSRYAIERRHAIEHGVNRFTDRLTRILLGNNGRFIRPTFRAANLALHLPPIRRNVLRRLAMLR